MTHRAKARVGGIAFLVYIVAGILTLVLSNHATGGTPGLWLIAKGVATPVLR